MRFWIAIFGEFFENLPMVVAFVFAVRLWRQQLKKAAAACAVIGVAISVLIIRFTEPAINGIPEPIEVTVVNFLVFSLGMLFFTMYLGAEGQSRWSNWKTDLILGWTMGILVGVSQALAAARVQIIALVVHSLAMALPIPLALISTRVLLKNVNTFRSALVRSIFLAIVVTVIISLVDYTYLLFL